MTPFSLYIECPHCGGDLDWVTGTPNPSDKPKREDTTVLKCRRNGHHLWVVRVELLKAPVDPRAAERQRKVREKARRMAVAA